MRSVSLTALVLLTACGEPQQSSTPPEPKESPNVLFIAVDDLNTMLNVMSPEYGAVTPNFDRLAARGTLFTNAHCQAPLCGPSRASIMTGLRPSTTGIYGMAPDEEIRLAGNPTADITYLPEYFGENGYRTMGIGKIFHHHAPEDVFQESGGRYKGFGPHPAERFVWDGVGTSDRKRYGKTNTDWGAFPAADTLMPDHQSVDWAIDRVGRSYERPFFLAVGLLRPHVPLYVPQKWFDLYPLENIKLPPYRADDLDDVPATALKINDLPMMPSTDWAKSSGEWPKIVQAYLACVSFVDYEVGRLLDALEESPHARNTIVVLWSDHGYRLGEKGTFAKHALWEPATKIPLIFTGPGITPGRIVAEPTELLALYPTLLELCGLPPYARNEGRSLAPVLKGGEVDAGSVAITTFGRNNHSVRNHRYRYIRYEDGGEELYDYTTDPDEFTNLASDPGYAKIMAELRERLPAVNAPWHEHSRYTFQPYFVEQKARTIAGDGS